MATLWKVSFFADGTGAKRTASLQMEEPKQVEFKVVQLPSTRQKKTLETVGNGDRRPLQQSPPTRINAGASAAAASTVDAAVNHRTTGSQRAPRRAG